MTDILDDLLNEWEIVTGSQGDVAGKKACPVALLSIAYGSGLDDHPDCAHRMLCDLVIRTVDNNQPTDADKEAIVRAGFTGLLDTFWIRDETIVEAHAWRGDGPDERTPIRKCIDVLDAITWWKQDKKRADLTRANLTRAYLTDAYLTDANLTRANLTGADLTRADLTRADLTGANLTDANLTGAYLTRADLTRADLTGAYLTRADLTRADLTRANLTGAYLTDAYLTGANLTRANLTGAYLTDAYLTGAYLTRADLTGADLTSAYLTGADLTSANLTGADLTRARGDRYTRLPDGWKVDEATGLILRSTEIGGA